MSHGEEGRILGSDDRWIPVKTLTSLMTSDLCPSLRDKPKLFFLQVMATCAKKHFITFCLWLTTLLLVWFHIQACRGMEFDHGVEADGEEAPGEFVGISDVPEVDFLCCYSTVEGLHCTDRQWHSWLVLLNFIHKCIYFSTGYYSWRNPEKGSVFISELCKMLKDCHLEIIQTLTRVNHHVAYHFQSHTIDPNTHMKRQMPCLASRLTKDFYLHVAEKKKK